MNKVKDVWLVFILNETEIDWDSSINCFKQEIIKISRDYDEFANLRDLFDNYMNNTFGLNRWKMPYYLITEYN